MVDISPLRLNMHMCACIYLDAIIPVMLVINILNIGLSFIARQYIYVHAHMHTHIYVYVGRCVFMSY